MIENFAAFAGRNIVLAPDVGDSHVTADIRNVEWQLGLDQILAPLGLVARVARSPANLLHNVHAFHHLAENAVLVVEPRRSDDGDEKLAAIAVRAGVGHRKNTGF